MRVYGLTGGIASGKSRIAALFAQLGASVLDADEIAREVVAPGQPLLERLVRRFGPDVLAPDGSLERRRLRDRVFANPEDRKDLDALVHPEVVVLSCNRLRELGNSGADLVIYEASLLIESGIDLGFAGLIVVDASESLQIARVMLRDGIDEERARAALSSQATRAQRLARADFVIDNDGDWETTRRQVLALWSRLMEAKETA